MRIPKQPIKNEAELMERCQALEGQSFGQLASALQIGVPMHPVQRKGWAGQAIELALGGTAGTAAVPDFEALGIELKTIPINARGKPAESTFVTSIPLLALHQQSWKTSQCYAKLKRVLWLPIEGDTNISFLQRRIGRGVLWSPTPAQESILEKDWSEFALLISTGRVAEITASMGDYLQVRPKAANAKSLCLGLDEHGEKTLTLPRGFYLRTVFTATIVMF